MKCFKYLIWKVNPLNQTFLIQLKTLTLDGLFKYVIILSFISGLK